MFLHNPLSCTAYTRYINNTFFGRLRKTTIKNWRKFSKHKKKQRPRDFVKIVNSRNTRAILNACHLRTTLLIRNNPHFFWTENNLEIAENPCAVYGKCEFSKCKLSIIFDLIFTSDVALIRRNKLYCLCGIQKMFWR